MTTPNLVLKEALRIAELGHKVLPCSQDKEPILKGWPEKATTDAEQIKAWFSNTNYLVAVKLDQKETYSSLTSIPRASIGWQRISIGCCVSAYIRLAEANIFYIGFLMRCKA